MTAAPHVYEVRPRRDKRGVDLIPMCCHSVGCATVSRKTAASAIACAKFYCALSSVWKTPSHFPPFFTQTLALLMEAMQRTADRSDA
jgi:hypothetical protein